MKKIFDYLSEDKCNELLFEVEMKNLPIYGYGIKPFTLSLIEAAKVNKTGNSKKRRVTLVALNSTEAAAATSGNLLG